MTSSEQIRLLINRLARLDSAESWSADINPAQRAALEYLRDANRFSRSPSHVAEFLGTTRGTMSQTLKALSRKGYVLEERSESDKRSISYALSEHGAALLSAQNPISTTFDDLDAKTSQDLEAVLRLSLRNIVEANAGKSFGLCKTCDFHESENGKPFCALLTLPLTAGDAEKICVEHQES